MARELKEIIVADFKEHFRGLEGCVLIDYHGLNFYGQTLIHASPAASDDR